jgi:hypothetical protein
MIQRWQDDPQNEGTAANPEQLQRLETLIANFRKSHEALLRFAHELDAAGMYAGAWSVWVMVSHIDCAVVDRREGNYDIADARVEAVLDAAT